MSSRSDASREGDAASPRTAPARTSVRFGIVAPKLALMVAVLLAAAAAATGPLARSTTAAAYQGRELLATIATQQGHKTEHGHKKVRGRHHTHTNNAAIQTQGIGEAVVAGMLFAEAGSEVGLRALLLLWLVGTAIGAGYVARLLGEPPLFWLAAASSSLTTGSLAVAFDGLHPALLALLPQTLGVLLVLMFQQRRELWQTALAGTLLGLGCVLDLRLVGVTVAIGVHLAVLARRADIAPRRAIRGLGAYAGGFTLAAAAVSTALLVYVETSPAAWLVSEVRTIIKSHGSTAATTTRAVWLHSALAIVPIALLAVITCTLRRVRAAAAIERFRFTASTAWFIGLAVGVAAGGRVMPEDIAIVAPAVAVHAVVGVDGVFDRHDIRTRAWPVYAVLVGLVTPAYLHAAFIVRGLTSS